MSEQETGRYSYDFTAWALLAVDGLVPAAQARIRREIEAHYADSVAIHRAEGLSRDDAESRALLELGDIESAAKGFRKRYLTVEDESWLSEYEAAWRKASPKWKQPVVLWVVLPVVLLSWVGFGWWLIHLAGTYNWDLALGSIVAFLLATNIIFGVGMIARMVAYHPPGVDLRRKLLRATLVQSQIFICGITITPWVQAAAILHYPVLSLVVLNILLVAAITPFTRRYRLLRKLRYQQIPGDDGVTA
jgi:hypothetical protein